jgi:uncharacterized membrane-anchored protein YhcB (DUF1043 family)
MDPTLLMLLSFAAGAVAAAIVTIWLERRGGRSAHERAAELEIELSKTRSELDAQRAQVASHFERTSDLFRDLTGRYTQLYAHLADGARQFCRDELPAIARGLDGLLPAGEADAPEPPPEEGEPHRPEAASGESPSQA